MRQNDKDNLIKLASVKSIDELNINYINKGLNKKQIEQSEAKYHKNNLNREIKDSIWFRLKRAFINPYSIVLMIIGIISLFVDVIFQENKNYTTISIIATMLVISGIIRLVQELKAKKVTDNLLNLININATVRRDGFLKTINYQNLVIGDIVCLKSGEQVPADIRLLEADNLFVSQSMITGESQIEEKNTEKLDKIPAKIKDFTNTIFQGTTVVSGSCVGIVLGIGSNTYYGNFSSDVIKRKNSFEKTSTSIIWVLIKFMLILTPIVFIAVGLTKGNWLNAFIFALSVAVGLTPELLPMVVNACLAHGTAKMAKKKTVIKNLNAMNDLGNMDVLCIDKTGTLTNDELILEYYMDILGNESNESLDFAYLNSYFSSSFDNHIDAAIRKTIDMQNNHDRLLKLIKKYQKVDELPFDYQRKVSSVLIKDENTKLLISKGPVDAIMDKCIDVKYKNKIIPIKEDANKNVHEIIDEMENDGMKVLALSIKEINEEVLNPNSETNMTLIGYLCFFDSPKESAYRAIQSLHRLNVTTKILTGDNKNVTQSICSRLGFHVSSIITGEELDKLNDDELQLRIEHTQIFTELSPKQKSLIVDKLKENGHIVGFLGDGLNDLHAMTAANVGISVDNAASSLKKIADIILLKKDLNVLKDGILEGRKSFNNMSKYIKITASSNLGNILSIVLASVFLPFLPMTSIQLLLLNLLYDILCLVLPWDNVDLHQIKKPHDWSGTNLTKFMLVFGPISSIFDLITFVFLMFYICPNIAGGAFNSLTSTSQQLFISTFQTGWFLESMWTQVLIIHLLRTDKIPFIQSKPALIVIIITALGIISFTVISLTPLGQLVGLSNLPWIYFIFLLMIVICYWLTMSLVKHLYLKRNHTLI